ncbi:MAG: EAL domain-containing protein [Campylobacterota bacterium]|nr:EAL domain-containing protein [Campylobacterota bacterium]
MRFKDTKQIKLPFLLNMFLLYFIILIVSFHIFESGIANLKEMILNNTIEDYHQKSTFLMDEKVDDLLRLGIVLAQDKSIIEAVLKEEKNVLNLKPIEMALLKESALNDLGIELIDSRGISFYRSDGMFSDNTIAIKALFKRFRIDTSINEIKMSEEGLVFESIVPIRFKNRVIGAVRLNSSFKALSKEFQDLGLQSIFLAEQCSSDFCGFNSTLDLKSHTYLKNNIANFSDRDMKVLLLDKDMIFSDKIYNDKDQLLGRLFYVIPLRTIDFGILMKAKKDFFIIFALFYLLVLISTYLIYKFRRSQDFQNLSDDVENFIEEETRGLDAQKQFLQNAIDGISESVMVINLDYSVSFMNKNANPAYNTDILTEENAPKCYELYHQRSEACSSCPMLEVIESGAKATVIHAGREKSGELSYYELTATPLFDSSDKVKAIVEVGYNVTSHLRTQTKLKEQKDDLDYIAHHDVLTGLPNRLLLIDRLEHLISKSKREKIQVALLFLDMDRFKQINDSLGHSAGDHLLITLAERFTRAIRSVDTVARLGGDEFVVVIEGIEDRRVLLDILKKLLEEAAKVIQYEAHNLYTTASIGVTLYPKDGDNAEVLFKHADTAMYRAKELGGNLYQFYTEDMTEKAMKKVVMESGIRQGLMNEEFYLEYQPQFDARWNKLIGMEALVRWNHPEYGEIGPGNFVPIAEESGLIIELGEYVLRAAARQAFAWNREGFDPKHIAVNLSIKQLEDKVLLEKVLKILEEEQCRPEWLEIEVTERYIMNRTQEAIERLRALKEIGLLLSMDDFGTGYSSLSELKYLPIYKLKIDASFIKGIPGDKNDEAIVCSIIDLAENMNLEVLAEGVEHENQREFLLDHGCTQIQGFLYSSSISASAMTQLLESH